VSEVKSKNIVAYSILVLALSVQFIIILAVIFSFIPIKLNGFVQTLLPLYWDQVRPHRQLQFYTAFILFGTVIQAWGMIFLKKQLQDNTFANRLWPFVILQWVWVLIEATAAFKIFVFGSPQWAKWFLYLSILGWGLNIVFWPEIKKWSVSFFQRLAQPFNTSLLMRWVDVLVPVVVVLLLWPPDMTKLLAHIFAWDSFFHLDFFVMAPGWAYLHGLSIDMDVNSNYNVVLPAFLSTVAKCCGGFTYENVLRLIIIGTLAYFVAAWVLLRVWLKSRLLAAFGLLLLVKLMMFHWGILPVLWRYPSATPVRYLFDLIPVFLIYKHSTTGREKYLWLASAATGLMMAYILEVGIYLALGFYAYVLMLVTIPPLRKNLFTWPEDIRKIVGLCIVPFVAAFVLLWMVEGQAVWSGVFWANTTEYGRLFLAGLGSLPVWDGLRDKQFFAFCMGFVIPAVYVLTIMIVGALLYLSQIETPQMFVVYLCVYGLGLYHYFVYRSGVTSYYVVCLPFVFVLCFWIQQIFNGWQQQYRRIILIGLVILTFGALVTGYLFTVYPNALNLAGLDYSQEIAFYQKEFNFQEDVAVIDRLTSVDDRVPLISSYETKILMEAQRKPFFYYFPMVYSEPMENLDFKGTEILTVDRMRRTLGQLDQEKPEYVFIEKKLFLGQLPQAYYQHFQTLTILIQYLSKQYQAYDQGEYLLVLKRK
jgi:hypothetical protein